MKNPYRILKIPIGSDINIVRKQYHKIAKKYHPDTSPYNGETALDKMQEINDAFQKIKSSASDTVVIIRPQGRFTKSEIEEIVRRFNAGQSLYKIGRDMKRRQKSIVRHLIKLGLMEQPVHEEEKDILLNNWYFDFSVLTLLMIVWPVAAVIFTHFIFMKSMFMKF